jgi:putative ABC transport system permease protein
MKIMVAIRIALRALRVNRMRSALTMLGVVIGVAAVIAMVAVGSGATARIQQQIEAIGSNLIMVIPGSITSNGIRLGSGAVVTLSEDDARAIAAECPSVSVVAPFVRGGVQVMYANNNWATSVLGTTPDYLVIRNQPVAQGNPFTVDDVNSAAKVALLGRTVAQNLFGGADPVGQTIRIKNVPFLVDGVLSAKGQTPTGQDQDDLILVPISTAKRNVTGASQANAGAVGSIMVQAAGPGAIDQAQSEVEELLRQRHRLQPDQDDDFTIRNLSEVFAAEESAAQAMSILLGAIASVSLLVGGIGIMNIMLVSVTERTREIGLRLAVGAKMKDILSQFLVEAVTLSVVGGVIGIVVGISASALISYFAKWSILVSPTSIAMAFFFSALVGISFGYYPARKAAFLDPIEALRAE